MDRRTTYLWMKDILEHMSRCHDQWQEADDRTERYLVDSMRRDVDEFRHLCDSLADRNAACVASG